MSQIGERPPGPPLDTTAPRTTAETARTARQFEAMAVDQMLQPMFATIDDANDMFGGGSAEAMMKPMLVTEFAKLMEARGGLGLAHEIAQRMEQPGAHVAGQSS